MLDADTAARGLTRDVFRELASLLEHTAGIRLRQGKESLVRNRLNRRLDQLGLADFRDYVRRLRHDRTGEELEVMVDLMTTNKTSFFRESRHFDYLRDELLPELSRHGEPIRIWSAGCATGEEPYTIALVIRHAASEGVARETRILATDISRRALAAARGATYSEDRVREIPAPLLDRYFRPVQTDRGRAFRVCANVAGLVRTARLNLLDPWPIRGPFAAIFCRNVMIYFDPANQRRLIRRLVKLLGDGGRLFVGLAENLTQCDDVLRYVAPGIYAPRRGAVEEPEPEERR